MKPLIPRSRHAFLTVPEVAHIATFTGYSLPKSLTHIFDLEDPRQRGFVLVAMYRRSRFLAAGGVSPASTDDRTSPRHLQFLLSSHEQLAVDERYRSPVVAGSRTLALASSLNPTGPGLDEIQLRVAGGHQQQTVGEDHPAPHERGLLIGLLLDLAIDAHRHEAVAALVDR
jgi:hypothetical protein